MTDALPPSNLKKQSMTAMLWSGADLFLRQGVQFVVTVILARLLLPEEFGTIALLYLFTGIASVFIDGGFSSALVQKQDATQTDESTVFWINLVIGIVSGLALWAMAPLIAEFFGYPILVPLTGMLAIGLTVNALGSIHLTLFGKNLDFKKPMFVSAVASIVSGVTTIALVINDFGIWALAWQTIVASMVSTLMLWLVSPWRPTFEFSLYSARGLFRFGSYLMLSALIEVAYSRMYALLIGKLHGVRELAYYNRADNTKQIPVDVLSDAFARVIFPVFSAAAGDTERLRNGVRLSVQTMMLIQLPMMFGLMATAENCIYVLFGERWLSVAPILQVLCIAGMFWPLQVINLNVLKAQGHSDLFFRLEIVKKIVGIISLLIGSFYGVMGIAWCQVAYSLVSFLINAYYTKHQLRYGAYEQICDSLRTILVAILMAIAVHFLGAQLGVGASLTLFLQVSFGVTMFVLLARLFRLEGYKSITGLFRRQGV